MFHRHTLRFVLAACLACAAGCTSWKMPNLHPNQLRDPRAVDIDGRLGGAPPTVSEPAFE